MCGKFMTESKSIWMEKKEALPFKFSLPISSFSCKQSTKLLHNPFSAPHIYPSCLFIKSEEEEEIVFANSSQVLPIHSFSTREEVMFD